MVFCVVYVLLVKMVGCFDEVLDMLIGGGVLLLDEDLLLLVILLLFLLVVEKKGMFFKDCLIKVMLFLIFCRE